MNKRKLKALALLLAAYAILTVGVAYAFPNDTIPSASINVSSQDTNAAAADGLVLGNVAVSVSQSVPSKPDSVSITLYHVGYGFYKWANITLTYNTAPSTNITWNAQLFIYTEADSTPGLTDGDYLAAASEQVTITINSGSTSGSATAELFPPVFYTQIDYAELVLSP